MRYLWTVFVGCGGPAAAPSPEVVPAPPPPSGVELIVDPAVSGLPSPLTVVVLGAGAGVRVMVARAPDGFGSSCPPGLPGCFGRRDAEEASRGVTDAAGVARLWWTPDDVFASGWLQAMVLGPGDGFVLSTPEYSRVSRSLDALDDDGLPYFWEQARGLDPAQADGDRGGTSDAQEVWIDGTDPTDPSDDVAVEALCFNLEDDDGDGVDDCTDPDCAAWSVCPEVECGNGADDDEDGAMDCGDPDCAGAAPCGEAACDDGLDDDGDGLVDCLDADCLGLACQDEIVAWIERADLRVARDGFGVPRWLSASIHGGVWVSGPGGARVCPFAFDGGEGLGVESGCDVVRDVIPDIGDLVLDPGGWLLLPGGAPWIGPLVYQPRGRDAWWEWSSTQQVAPWATCAGGAAPLPVYPDRDGDGVGRDPVDLYGRIDGPWWVCDPAFGGVSTTAGDCDDGDPTWTPARVRVAGGVGCADLRWDDRDGDGARVGDDADDRDGTVQ